MSIGLARRGIATAATVILGLATALLAGMSPAQAQAHAPAPALASAPASRTSPPSWFQVCEYTAGAKCAAMRRLDIPPKSRIQAQTSPPDGYTPHDLQRAYDLPSATRGAGQIVGIITGYDDPTAEDDLAVYRQQFRLPACTSANGCFRTVNQRGGATTPSTNYLWSQQASLDIDMVTATCPLCRIVLVEADDATLPNLAAAVDEAVSLGAKFVVNSYSTDETADELAYDVHYHHPGVLITANSGQNGPGAAYPAASPYVMAVGGTTLARTATNNRGWAETAWAGQRSGCSRYEPKPAFQHDTLCSRRTVADVAAVNSPATGVAVYNGYSDSYTGWAVYGGGAAAIIAGAAALNGSPPATGQPNAYPYSLPQALHDITAGGKVGCTHPGLCTAVAGYDGPTGVGTPVGDAAFAAPAPRGILSGTVTSTATSKPVAGALVVAATESARTDRVGHYQLILPVGSYTLRWTAYGYLPKTVSGVVVTDGTTTTAATRLTPAPLVNVSGRVLDGSGGGWPMYARISVRGTPIPPTYSNPFTGDYTLRVPAQAAYTLEVTPQYAGYQPGAVAISVGLGNVAQTLRLSVDDWRCTAAGYAPTYAGVHESFDSGTRPPGWSVVDKLPGVTWTFTDPAGIINRTGGTGGYAGINSDYGQPAVPEDTSLVSPVADLTRVAKPVLVWDTHYVNGGTSRVYADITTDRGRSWQTVWSIDNINKQLAGPATVNVPLPQAAGQPSVQVRFRWVSVDQSWYWQVDNVVLGQYGCAPTAGGRVAGYVTDRNTGRPLDSAVVASLDQPAQRAITVATPDDPAVGDGFYSLPTATGSQRLTATVNTYPTLTGTVTVVPRRTTRHDFALAAPLVSVSTTAGGTQPLGSSRTATFTVRNNGSSPAHVHVSEQSGAVAAFTGTGAAVARIAGAFSPRRSTARPGPGAGGATPSPASAAPWREIADYPGPIMSNTVGYDNGRIYSVGGQTDGLTTTASGYAYDPRTGVWTPIADLQHARALGVGAFINGKFYVTGGWAPDGSTVATTEIYDPASDLWSAGTDEPTPLAGSAVAVAGGRLYVVGGCVVTCGSAAVQVYDPATKAWTQATDYPELTSMLACGSINAKLYCAGGVSDGGTNQSGGATTTSSVHGYLYDPASRAWSRIADAPVDVWGSAYTAADNQLLLSTGVINNSSAITNEGWRYNPVGDSWSSLPNASIPAARSGSTCGLYKIGGDTDGQFNPTSTSEVLPGLDGCAGAQDVPWLTGHPTDITVAAGASATFPVTTDAGAVSQPGTYRAALTFTNTGPTPIAAASITMTVTPPASWGKITGTVTGTSCGTTAPLAGATVQLTSPAGSWTLTTDAHGRYLQWLDSTHNPVQVIAAKNTWRPQVRSTKILAGRTTENFVLLPINPC